MSTGEAIKITVRYFAAARAAAGVEDETLAVPVACTIEGLTRTLGERRPALAPVLSRCSFLVDEVAVRERSRALPDGSTVDVLPPFAGG